MKIYGLRTSFVAILFGLAFMPLLFAPTANAQNPSGSSLQGKQELTVKKRIKYQRAIEEVYWRHSDYFDDTQKSNFEMAIPQANIKATVKDYLAKVETLGALWGKAISDQEIQEELDKLNVTESPELLKELNDALLNDEYLVRECLIAPRVADRLLRQYYAADDRFASRAKTVSTIFGDLVDNGFEEWWIERNGYTVDDPNDKTDNTQGEITTQGINWYAWVRHSTYKGIWFRWGIGPRASTYPNTYYLYYQFYNSYTVKRRFDFTLTYTGYFGTRRYTGTLSLLPGEYSNTSGAYWVGTRYATWGVNNLRSY